MPAPVGGGLCEDVPRRTAGAGRDRRRAVSSGQRPKDHKARRTGRVTTSANKPREDRAPREDRHRARIARVRTAPKARQHAPTHERGAAPGDMENGVWFRLNVGRERNADPKWLLPEICRQGELTKKDIGAIRVFEMETLFQVARRGGAEIHHPGQRAQEGRGAHLARAGPDRRNPPRMRRA